jgi:hypothetical protein
MGENEARRAAWKNIGDKVSKRLWFLDTKTLCAKVQLRTGLHDFGEPPVEPPLEALINSLQNEADLHPLGRFLMHVRLQSLLENRLRLVDEWHTRSQKSAELQIRRPIFITGMPRSGSSFLHELFSRDLENRTPQVWEVMHPVPARRKGKGEERRRIRKTATALWWFRRLAHEPDSVYPVRACSPHECVAIHGHTFLSQEFICTARVPGYEKYVRSSDLTPVYAWQKRFLQYLQTDAPSKRWVLKAPDHVYALKEIFSVFPDAVIIQTHRNPLEVLRSSIQLTEILYNLFAWPGSREALAEREASLLAGSMDRFIRFRDMHPELAGRFIDLNYSDLVADPLAAVQRVYRQLDLALTKPAADRMQHLISQRSRYRKYTPTLAEFGVDVLREARRFSQYCFRFGVPCQ